VTTRPVEQEHLPLGWKATAIAAIPGVLLVDTGLAIARGWQTRSRLDLLVAVVPALILLTLFSAIVLPRGRELLGRYWAHLAFVMCSGLAAWLAAEAVVACYLYFNPLEPRFHERTPHMSRVFRPLPGVMPGIQGDSRFTINSMGIRGLEPPGRDAAFRILCIGGSTTECIYLDDQEAWPHLLMQQLQDASAGPKVWVGNAGMSGYTTVEHLKYIQQSDLMDEIDCIVLLVGANDFLIWLLGELQYHEASRKSPGPIWGHSCILAAVRVFWHRPRRSIEIEDRAGANYVIRRRERRQAPVNGNLPDLEQPLHDYSQRLKAIVKESESKGVEIVFVVQPTLWREGLSAQESALLWLGRMKDGRYIAAEAGRKAINRYNDTLLATCNDMGVKCVDLRSMNGQQEFFYDDFHFNEAGAREVASLVAQSFLDEQSDIRVSWPPAPMAAGARE
jgi:lysophospholipase L1-like esterase